MIVTGAAFGSSKSIQKSINLHFTCNVRSLKTPGIFIALFNIETLKHCPDSNPDCKAPLTAVHKAKG